METFIVSYLLFHSYCELNNDAFDFLNTICALDDALLSILYLKRWSSVENQMLTLDRLFFVSEVIFGIFAGLAMITICGVYDMSAGLFLVW